MQLIVTRVHFINGFVVGYISNQYQKHQLENIVKFNPTVDGIDFIAKFDSGGGEHLQSMFNSIVNSVHRNNSNLPLSISRLNRP